MRAGVVQSLQPGRDDDRQRSHAENDGGEDQHVEHRHLDFARLDLLAEILRCPAHHQAGDEDASTIITSMP